MNGAMPGMLLPKRLVVCFMVVQVHYAGLIRLTMGAQLVSLRVPLLA